MQLAIPGQTFVALESSPNETPM